MFNTLYYKNNYMSEFNAKVIECTIENDVRVVLNDTAFYPEGGGQNADKGTLNEFSVIDVKEIDGKIYHIIEKQEGMDYKKIFSINSEVIGKIDFENRFANMQNHTAEHIVSGIICKKYNAQNVGFHMGKDFVTMDFNVNLSKKEIEEIEKEANEAIYKNIEIKEKIYTKEQAEKIYYRSKKSLSGEIRIIEIPGVDICACCGIHVKRTGEIGILKLFSVEKYKTGCRIYMLTGQRAIDKFNNLENIINKLTTILSSKDEQIVEYVGSLLEEIKDLKAKNSKIQFNNIKEKINNLDIKENQILFLENIDTNIMKNISELLYEKTNNISAIFLKENDKYKYLINSKNMDLMNFIKDFNNALDGKGGGSSFIVQGQVKAEKEKIENYLNNKLKNI